MLHESLIKAINDRSVVSFLYDGKIRIVEPHALGTNKGGELILRAYQTEGESATNPMSWKLFTLSKMESFSICPDDFESHAPRPGYNPGDRAMLTILAELPEKVLEEV